MQSVRLSTQSWDEYLNNIKREDFIKIASLLEKFCKKNGIDFLSIGTTFDSKFIDIIPEILKRTTRISCTVTIGDNEKGINFGIVKKTAKTILELSRITKKGIGNFNFAAIINCPADTPFFPASYHKGKPAFSIGIEGGDLIVKAFSVSKNLWDAKINLQRILDEKFKKIEKISQTMDNKDGFSFKGIDLSPAPSLIPEESIAYGFEKLLKGKFGTPGTLTIAEMITNVLQHLNIKSCGYSGLMLPILEDVGLAQRYKEKTFNISNLLQYSAVCGTGLDCVPLPGNISLESISGLLLDVATLSIKLSKPLSARLLPCTGKTAGDMTDFDSPYLTDTLIRDSEG